MIHIDKKVIAYWHVHIFWAFMTALVFYKLGLTLPWVGICPGLIVELYQMYKYNRKYPYIDDIIDLITWFLGGFLIYLI